MYGNTELTSINHDFAKHSILAVITDVSSKSQNVYAKPPHSHMETA